MVEKNTQYKRNNPLVSIVIPTYKRDITLGKALGSITNQSYKNIEVIVVDDNANNQWNTKVANIIDQTRENLNLVYIKNETNKGSAQTRNIGIREAKGEYVTFLDDDDIYLTDKVSNQVKHMINEKSDFSITDLELFDENGKWIEKRTRDYIKSNKKEDLMKYHLMHHMTGTDTLMFKKEYLLKVGGFPPINVGDEFYLMKRAIEEGGTFSYLPVCDIKAYVHTLTEGLSSGDSKIKGENELYELKKEYFSQLDRKAIRYIKMRHYAVLAFAEIRRKNYMCFFRNAIVSMVSSPVDCVKLLVNR